MTAQLVHWARLRVGDLFKTRDDAYLLRVLATFPGGVLVLERGLYVQVHFRPGVQVLRVHVRK